MKMFTALVGAVFMLISPLANASPIFYWTKHVEGDRWQYDYAVGNEIGTDIDWFTIWFDPSLYELDTVDFGFGEEVDPDSYVGPAEWDIFVAAPDPLFTPPPTDDQFGFYDAFAFGDPVSPGQLVSGFSITFTWLGDGTPGSQPFTLFGDDLLPELQDNYFTQVPEPGTLGLLGACIALLGFARRSAARG